MNISKYNQYKNDFFNKLNFSFKQNKLLLDVGCGEGTDAEVFINEYKLKFFGTDVYKDKAISDKKLNFKLGTIFKIPYKDNQFDYVFVHDVLHHADEPKHRELKHLQALKELMRVCKKGGDVIIIEGNRYNPLFFPHMVKMRKHEHLRHFYFKRIINKAYENHNIKFKFFEAHYYPQKLLFIFKIYEFLMEAIIPKRYLAYNVAIIRK
jgi:ubiquinone/menaquinone biosynthesis C-methylase UbiE